MDRFRSLGHIWMSCMKKIAKHKTSNSRGAAGGDASVEGDSSVAIGGNAGDAVIGPGGPGGAARVVGRNSRAEGGRGGRGGIGTGGPGGSAEAFGDNMFVGGGDGGEASQADGRGGRGGLPHRIAFEMFGVPRREMKHPYWEPNLVPGRGGDSADTPQYCARRLILEEHKLRYFAMIGESAKRIDVWFDRDVVPLAWLNEQLKADGHLWFAQIVDQEYEFRNLDS